MDNDIITITGSGCSDNTVIGDSGVDTITLDSYTGSYNINMASYNAAGIGGASGSSSMYTITTGAGANGTYLTSGGTGTTSWSTANIPAFTSSSTASISVDGTADFKGDITLKGKSLNDWMESMEKRLAILVPDPKKLEQYEALQKAYKHYKMLEALCEVRDEDETK